MSKYQPKLGDRVRVVLETEITWVSGNGVFATRLNGFSKEQEDVVSIEKLADPEPEWQRGDVVVDAIGTMVVRLGHPTNYDDGQWTWLQDGQPGNGLRDFHLVRPLTPLVRNGKPWPASD